jgi:hypothetical protein
MPMVDACAAVDEPSARHQIAAARISTFAI